MRKNKKCLERAENLTETLATQAKGRLARARARAPSEIDRFSMKAGQFREIINRFLLNELGDPHF